MKYYYRNGKKKFPDLSHFITKENVLIICSGVLVIVGVAIVFFNHLIAAVILSPYLFLWYQTQKRKQQEKRKKRVKQESKEFFQSLMNCLTAGYSFEQSISKVKKELHMMYSKENSVLIPELDIMERKLQMNQPLEDVFEEFARKQENEDFIQFAFILRTAKRKGGNLIQVLERTIDTIHRKNQVEEEIVTILAGRVFEKNIMKMIPIFLICYLRIFNSTYLEIMYETLAGRVCMLVSLVTMVIAGKLADKIVDIEV